MFMHNKRVMYTVRVGAPDPKLANLGDRESKLPSMVETVWSPSQ